MTDQPSLADLEYQGKNRRTRREAFLERMESPWFPGRSWRGVSGPTTSQRREVVGLTPCRCISSNCVTTPAFAGAGSQ